MRAREIKRKWVAALESGQYKQAQHTLYDPETKGFCCLGVLQHILLDGKVQTLDWATGDTSNDQTWEGDIGIADVPTKEFWDMFPQLKWVHRNANYLVAFNDTKEWNFEEIASYLRDNWKV